MATVIPQLPLREEPPEDAGLKLAIVGRPNVGKSSLVNALLGQDRVMVSDVAGTTRDAVDAACLLRTGDRELPVTLIDTAGLRRRNRLDSSVEVFSVMRAESAIKRADAVVLVLDCQDVATAQDRRIAHLIQEAEKPCLLVANKYDLRAAEDISESAVRSAIRLALPFMGYAPLQCVSARTGQNLGTLAAHLAYLHDHMRVKVPTSVVNQFIGDLLTRTPPPSQAGNRVFKVLYATMVQNPPPKFRLFVNHPRLCPPSYLRYLENQLQNAFFAETGLPVKVELRSRRRPDELKGGRRQAVAGIMRQKAEERRSVKRRVDRRKRRGRR
jgi:GTP-binding protein